MRGYKYIRLVVAVVAAGASAWAQASAPDTCLLVNPPNANQFAMGPTNYSLRLRPSGKLKAVMLFVDFPDAPANEDLTALFQRIVPPAQQWETTVSRGKVQLDVTPMNRWYRMPATAASYGFQRGLTFEAHKTYITDALTVADADVDYSQYDLYYIVASNTQLISFSPTFVPRPGQSFTKDGVEIRHVVTLGADARVASPNYGSWIIVHETGHLYGLLDLYDFATSVFPDFHRFVGPWDPMGWLEFGESFSAWDLQKLQWLSDTEVNCVGKGQIQEQIAPLTATSGVKAVVVPLSTTKALVAEVRAISGVDQRLCDSGVLLYTVDSTIASGSGPMRVIEGSPPSAGNCGPSNRPLANATFRPDPGKRASYTDASGVSITVDSKLADGSYKVTVRNPVAVSGAPELITPVAISLQDQIPVTVSVDSAQQVAFSVSADQSWIRVTPTQSTTTTTINVSADGSLAQGNYNGAITLRTATSTRRIGVTARITGQARPTVTGLVHAATFKQAAIVPGLLVTFTGRQLGPATLTTLSLDENGLVATTLAGTRVLFDGKASPLVYVSDTQTTAIVPYSLAGKSLVNIQVEYNGQTSPPITSNVAQAWPGLFTAEFGTGVPAGFNQDGSLLTATSPAPRGTYVTLFGSGEGTTTPGGIDGKPNAVPFPLPTQTFSVTIGRVKADVAYFGGAPGLVAGVFQLNVKVPESLAAGNHPIVITVGGVDSVPGVVIPVQ